MPSLFAALPVVTLRQAEGAVDGANDDNGLMSDENGVVVLVVLVMVGSGTNGLIAIASIVSVATVATNPTKANPSIIHLPHLGGGGDSGGGSGGGGGMIGNPKDQPTASQTGTATCVASKRMSDGALGGGGPSSQLHSLSPL
jgi:hypothetical protein